MPVNGGMYDGVNISAAAAKKRALFVAYEMARLEAEECAGRDNTSVKELFARFMRSGIRTKTAEACQQADASFKFFAEYVGERVMSGPVREVTRAAARGFADSRREDVRCGTAKKNIAYLRSAFRYAEECGMIESNPFARVRVAADTKEERILLEAFTLEEVRELLAKLPEEWAGAVRVCLGTYGQRLRDCLNVRWDAVDWDARTVRIVTGKTGRVLVQPMQKWFYEWMRERYERARTAEYSYEREWVLPHLHFKASPSVEFSNFVRAYGMGTVSKSATGGRRRVRQSKTFHSLRATVATMIQEAGLSQGMAMDLVGHESAAIHAAYIRPTEEQRRAASAMLPDFGAGGSV